MLTLAVALALAVAIIALGLAIYSVRQIHRRGSTTVIFDTGRFTKEQAAKIQARAMEHGLRCGIIPPIDPPAPPTPCPRPPDSHEQAIRDDLNAKQRIIEAIKARRAAGGHTPPPQPAPASTPPKRTKPSGLKD